MNLINSLCTPENVSATASHFFSIADALHSRLNSAATRKLFSASSTDLYAMLLEEYGLRARAAILRNNPMQHTVINSQVSSERLFRCLKVTADQVLSLPSASQLRSVVSSVSTLCVSISPGKGHVIDFLIEDLENELNLQQDKPNVARFK